MLLPATDAYEVAVFTGNLLYVRKAPGAVVVPSTAEEIISIVNFARDNDIHLSIKNGGHSYAAYCLNKGGIVLDMSQFKNVEINDAGTEVTIQAGCIWNDVYDSLKGRNLANIIVGGQCPTVGVSGFTLGGGLSPFSRSYGLGSDNVIEMTVVTAAGELLILNHDETDPEKRDLFWALRGGGGGNLGVLVEFKSRVHLLRDPYAHVVCGSLAWDLSDVNTKAQFEAAMDVFNSREWPGELTIDAIWRYKGDKLFGEMTTLFNGNFKQCLAVVEPLLKFNPTVNTIKEMQWHDWVVIEQGYHDNSAIYHHHASFIFGQGAITPAVTKSIISLMEESFNCLDGQGKSHFLWDMAGGKTKDVAPKDTPYYWREGIYVANFKIQWNHPRRNREMLAFVDKVKKTLMPHTLEGRASYLNYIDPTVEDWQYAYYGKNYPRLQKIKTLWDPTNFFHFPQAIERVGVVKKPTPIYSRVPNSSANIPVIGIINGPAIPIFKRVPESHRAEAESNAPANDHGRPLTALNRIAALWDDYSLPDPEKLWQMEEPNPDKVLMVIGGERIQADL